MNLPAYTTDTSADAEAVQLELLRQMTPQERLQKACDLSTQLRKMAFDAIRRRHPDYSEDEVRLKFIEVTYGKQLADDVRHWQEAQR
ncbi:MAG: hypothetical protein RIK87_01540 [Fuerstiella sp.]